MVKNSVLSRRTMLLPYIVFSVATLFYFYDFFLGVFPSAIASDLMRIYHIDAQGLGLLQAFFFYGYMPMQIPAGLLFDRFGVRKVLVTAGTVCAISIFIFAMSRDIYFASLSRLLMGLSTAFSYVGAVIVVSLWFPKRYLPLLVGTIQVMGSIGAIVGEAPISMLVGRVGMMPALLLAAAVGAIMAFLFWLLIHDHPDSHHHTHAESNLTEMQKLKVIFSRSQNWWNCVYGFGIWAPMSVFSITWGVLFLRSAYNLTNHKAALMMSLIWIGVAVGGPLLGGWSAYLCKRKPSMIAGAILGLFASTAIIYMPCLPPFVLYACLFCYGAASSAQAVSFGIVDDNNPSNMAGTAIGLQNMAIVTGGLTLVPYIGYWLKHHWLGIVVSGVPFYTTLEFQRILYVAPACFFLALVVSIFFIKETNCQRQP
ncbi:MAG: MFS transporter [Gammaproteobacteria bacterium]|nr:MFS transporter [Gammaproteobacteria bacterium]